MTWHFSPYAIAFTINAVLTVVLTLVVVRRRESPGGGRFCALSLAIAVWAFAQMLESIAVEQSAKVLWAKIEYLGIANVGPLWLMFALEYSYQARWLTRSRLALLWVIPTITIAMVFTNEWHGLIWSKIYPSPGSGSQVLIYEHGAWFWVHSTYIYLTIMAGALLLFQSAKRAPRFYRYRVGVLSIGIGLPLVLNAIYVLGLSPIKGIDPTPFGFTLSALIYGASFFRLHLFDLVPVARDALIESMQDGVLVLDAQNRIVDINPAVQRLIGSAAASPIGQSVDTVLAAWPDLVERYRDVMKDIQTEVRMDGTPAWHMDLRISPLYNEKGHYNGRLVVMRDITERKNAEESLRQSEERFRTLVDSMDDFIFTLDRDGRYTGVFGLWMEKAGLTPEAFLGRTARDIFGDIDCAIHEAASQRALAGEHVTFEWSASNQDRTFYYQTSLSPIHDTGGVIGIVGVGRDITDREQAKEELARNARAMAALYETSLAINSQPNLPTLLNTIIERATGLLGAAMGGLYLVSPDGQELELVISYNLPDDYTGTKIHLGEGISGRVAQTDEPSMVEDFMKEWEHKAPAFAHLPLRRSLAVPLKLKGKVIGIVNIVDADKTTPFTPEQIRLASLFADQAAIAVENARLYNEVQRLAIIDQLTDLYNYRGLLELGSREVERARRFNRPLAAFFFDVDNFRDFNNKFSHAIGNKILRAVAQRSRSSVRTVDLVTRYGGEEFVILLPEASLEAASGIAERLRQDIENTLVPTERGNLSVTVSIGVTQLTSELPDLLTLIDRANQAEHAAKEQGRNRIFVLE